MSGIFLESNRTFCQVCFNTEWKQTNQNILSEICGINYGRPSQPCQFSGREPRVLSIRYDYVFDSITPTFERILFCILFIEFTISFHYVQTWPKQSFERLAFQESHLNITDRVNVCRSWLVFYES